MATEIVPDETKAKLGEVILQADDVAQAVLYALSTPPHTQVEQITLRAVGEYFWLPDNTTQPPRLGNRLAVEQ